MSSFETENLKQVLFNVYCPQCKHEAVDETDEPCDTCLREFCRINSHKPEKWEEKG